MPEEKKPGGGEGKPQEGADSSSLKWNFEGQYPRQDSFRKHERVRGDDAKDPKKAPPYQAHEKKREIGIGPFLKDGSSDSLSTTRTSSDDPTYASFLNGEWAAEIGSFSYDPDDKRLKVTAVEVKLKGSVAHGQTAFKVDIGKGVADDIKHLLFGPAPPLPAPNPAKAPAPMAARVGDPTAHLSPLGPGPGSPNVFIGGLPAWRVGPDLHVCPAPGSHGAGPVSPGAATVFINGFPAARASDFVVEPMGGPNVIIMGCPTVLIGTATAPPAAGVPHPDRGEVGALVEYGLDQLSGWLLLEVIPEGDAGNLEAGVKAAGELDVQSMQGKAEIRAGGAVALLKGQLGIKLRARIPHTSQFIGVTVAPEASVLAAGAEIGGGVAINQPNKMFEATWGAKANAALAGIGIKLGLDVAPAGDAYAHLNDPSGGK